MVPRTSRGQSFAGASMYYFHDKGAETTERIEWSETYNVPTNDHYKAIKWMQYSAMNVNKLKQQMGVSTAGRKSTKGAVYTYSLSWTKLETPDREHMKSCLLQTLEVLGLKDHEAIFVCHNDTEHPHVHAIVNLVSPIDGKMNTLYNDQKKLSKWAEAYEKEHGIYCEKRIENNKKRALAQDTKKKTQYKQEQLKRAQLIYDLYAKSDSGKAFKAAMKEHGFDLTEGKRRAFSFVDGRGKIHSLSRHINMIIDKDQNPKWRSDMKVRLSSVELQDAQTISEQRKKAWDVEHYFDRDQYETDWQKSIVDGAIDTDNQKGDKPKSNKDQNQLKSKLQKDFAQELYSRSSNQYLEYLDAEQKIRNEASKKQYQAKKRLDDYYGDSKAKLVKKIRKIKAYLKGKPRQAEQLKSRLENLKKELNHINYYYNNQLKGANKKIQIECDLKLMELQKQHNLPSNDNQDYSNKRANTPNRKRGNNNSMDYDIDH